MAREGLQLHLSAAFRQAASRPTRQSCHRDVRVKTNGDGVVLVDVSVRRVVQPEAFRDLFLVTFDHVRPVIPESEKENQDEQPPDKPLDRVAELERELRYSKASHQSTVEELETANEELKSTNEELQSTNEELQSTNEELETSKEEMQSLNEELQTVNAELQDKVEELSQTNDDMKNLLNSTNIATIFLDNHLNIKRYTEQAKNVVSLIASDIGRPLADLKTKLQYDRIVTDAQDVLRTLVYKEVEVRGQDGTWYLMKTLPYRTTENAIDGLVMTFVDITSAKSATKAYEFANSIVQTVQQPLLVLDDNLCVLSVNRAFCSAFALEPADVKRKRIYEIGGGAWNIPELRRLLEEILPENTSFDDFEVIHEFPGIGRKFMRLNARRLDQREVAPACIFLSFRLLRDDSRGPS